MLSDRQLRICAWIVSEELARRQRFGHAVPAAFRDLHAALLREVSQPRHLIVEITHTAARLVTAAELAASHGVSTRTVQRRARKQGIQLTGGRYLFPTTED